MDWRALSRWVLAAFFVAAGANHFRAPDFYVVMIPAWLAHPAGLVACSGVAEIAGGIGVLVPSLRRAAGWGLVALLVAVFPANVHMALAHLSPPGLAIPSWVLWARLPFQAALVGWVWWTAAGEPPENPLE